MLKVGDDIRVPCVLSPGPFSEQHIITFDTVTGPISGFIDDEDVIRDDRGGTFVKGTVLDVSRDTIKLHINGSFFTTNGLATVSREMVAA